MKHKNMGVGSSKPLATMKIDRMYLSVFFLLFFFLRKCEGAGGCVGLAIPVPGQDHNTTCVKHYGRGFFTNGFVYQMSRTTSRIVCCFQIEIIVDTKPKEIVVEEGSKFELPCDTTKTYGKSCT